MTKDRWIQSFKKHLEGRFSKDVKVIAVDMARGLRESVNVREPLMVGSESRAYELVAYAPKRYVDNIPKQDLYRMIATHVYKANKAAPAFLVSAVRHSKVS